MRATTAARLISILSLVGLGLPAAAEAATLTRSSTAPITDTLSGTAAAETLTAIYDRDALGDEDMIYTATGGITGGVPSGCTPVAGGVRCETIPVKLTVTGGEGADLIAYDTGFPGFFTPPVATLNGGGGNDTLTGSFADDTVSGDGGDDTVTPGYGKDTIACDAASVADAVSYDDGRFVAVQVDIASPGPDGNSELDGAEVFPAACDVVIGTPQGDVLLGSDGANTLRGGAGTDTIDARGGDDLIVPGAGGDGTVIGGAGSDRASYDDGRTTGVVVDLLSTAGSDGDSGEQLSGIERLTGSPLNDTLIGDNEINSIDGGAGIDLLAGGTQDDQLNGGAGTDTISCTDTLAVASVNLTTEQGCEAGETAPDIENAIGTSGNDTLIGDSGANRLEGLAGNDTLTGDAGNDTILGGPGDDNPNGGVGGSDTISYDDGRATPVAVNIGSATGDDGDPGEVALEFENLTGGPSNDTLIGSSATNAINGAAGNDHIYGGLGGDTLDGGTGTDTLHYDEAGRSTGVVVDLSTPTGADGDPGEVASNFEALSGTNLAASGDTLVGTTGADTITGLAGNDTMRGNLGADTLNGGDGSDTISYADPNRAAAAATVVTLDPGGDSVDGGENPLGFEHAIGGPGPDTLVGTAQDNTLTGGPGADVLRGEGGADTLRGETGEDTLIPGGAADPVVDGGEGSDTASYADGRSGGVTVDLSSTAGVDGGPDDGGEQAINIENAIGTDVADQLTGSAAGNQLDGRSGDDTLAGAAGADTLLGGDGGDTLRGGGDADTLDGGAGDDLLEGGGAADAHLGGEGADTASYADRGAAEPVTATLDGVTPGGASAGAEGDTFDTAIENLRGGAGDDALTGGPGANALHGGDGSDVLDPRAGQDTVAAAAGNDEVRVRDGELDRVDCGDGDADKLQADDSDERAGCEQQDVAQVISDRDKDGIEDGQDCAPDDPAIRPGASEIQGNDTDENCDGIKEALPPPDADGDGQNALQDCNDNNAAIRPGAIEIVGNAIDENCDGINAPYPLLESGITNAFQSFPTFSRVITLTVTRLPAGATIVVSCNQKKDRRIRRASRRSCAFRSRTIRIARAVKERKLHTLFKHRRLAVGTVIKVQITAPNTIGKLQQFTVLRRKTQRRPLTCIAPGGRPTPC